ncbi:MAG: QsdR family transcriptional regulator [Thermoleophilaceae bacterium]
MSIATSESAVRRPGRRPGASREEVLQAALERYLRGRRIDIRAIAAELGLGRATVYRWFGSREDLIGEVLLRAAQPLLERARLEARGRGGRALLDTFDRFNRSLAKARALRQFIDQEHDAALRIIYAGDGRVQPGLVDRIVELIEEEVDGGRYEPPVDPSTLGYAIVKIAEAFLFSDTVAGVRGDVDRLREVQAALLGVSPGRPRRRR